MSQMSWNSCFTLRETKLGIIQEVTMGNVHICSQTKTISEIQFTDSHSTNGPALHDRLAIKVYIL
jgi:hypothetical protein